LAQDLRCGYLPDAIDVAISGRTLAMDKYSEAVPPRTRRINTNSGLYPARSDGAARDPRNETAPSRARAQNLAKAFRTVSFIHWLQMRDAPG